MEKQYTGTIPADMAEKLEDAGMPVNYTVIADKVIIYTTYGEVIDWMINKEIVIVLQPYCTKPFRYYWYEIYVHGDFAHSVTVKGCDWYMAANAAIIKAIEMMEEFRTTSKSFIKPQITL